MMDKLKKLKDKKEMHKMHPMEQKAKLHVLDDMSKMADDAMGDKLKGMNKVTVASDSQEGLEHGLDKAHDLLKNLPEALDDSHPDHENFAHTENKEDGEDGMSAYPEADDDHELEADPEAEHEEDEHEEGDDMMAEGGEVSPLEHDASPEPHEMYDHMDEAMLDRHLKHLLSLKKKKGMA